VKKACLAIVVMALAGCGTAGEWAKPGADRQATDLAYAQCRAAAAQAVDTDIAIDKDILATRGGDWQRAQIMPVETGRMRENTRGHGESVLAACMQAKGFAQADSGRRLPTPTWRLP
jgi:hypothetical protein